MTIEGDLNAICNVMREVSPKLKDIMNARLSDPKRIMGHMGRRRGRPQGQGQPGDEPEEEEDDSMLDYRILVHESQAGSVIGRGGERIKELRDKYKMRVIKVYQMLAPLSNDRVVQMVAEPDNAISCLKSVVEAVESAPPRGRREDYDAANFSEADALNYGGWLSREAVQAISQGLPLPGPGGMPSMGYGMGGPYMMAGDMGCGMGPMPGGMGPMGGGMGPMPGGAVPPMGGARPPVPGGRGVGPGGRGPRSGTMPGGPRPMMGGPPGPSPVPPPGGQRGVNAPNTGNPGGAYGGPPSYGGQGAVPPYEAAGGYDNGAMYGGMDQPAQPGYGSQSYGSGGNAMQSGGYGAPAPYGNAPRGAGDMSGGTGMPSRGGSYAGYGMSNPGMHDDAKVSQWYGGWS
ncbi:unnamed protein product [Echinostoma caproni]|uniref:KH domain-containing protein n=1 Tax=Echinostoma caproni TaxID=27848 RepID=A0A183A014_9TREM|nr:unnamed protein product [Echinostoma caproni]